MNVQEKLIDSNFRLLQYPCSLLTFNKQVNLSHLLKNTFLSIGNSAKCHVTNISPKTLNPSVLDWEGYLEYMQKRYFRLGFNHYFL